MRRFGVPLPSAVPRLYVAGAVVLSAAALAAYPHITAPPRPPPSVLLVVIDTLRADALGCYGAERPTSPNLDALAARSLVFEQAFSNAPWTLPAVASLFTGTYPSLHGQTESKGPQARLPEELVTLAEALGEAGYDTAAFSAHPWVSPAFGLSQGIATEDFQVFAFAGGDERVTESAVEWLRSRAEADAPRAPFFAYLHYMRPHSPYEPTPEAQRLVLGSVPDPPPFSAKLAALPFEQSFGALFDAARAGEVTTEDLAYLRGLYEAEVHMADTELGRVLAALRETGREEDTLVVVTSDHGEAFLEHGDMLHGSGVYPEMLHVPLIVHVPGRSAARVRHRVQHVDVLPTVLQAAGVEVPLQVQGVSRLPRRDRGESAVFAEAAFGTRDVRVMQGRFAFVAEPALPGAGRLYDLSRDPLETEDRAPDFPRHIRRFQRELERFLRENDERKASMAHTEPAVTPELLEALRSLGYTH